MTTRNDIRFSLIVAVALLSSACASTGGPDVAWGPVDGPMCTLRVESGYDVPVEAGVSAGSREIDLGELEPNDARELGVPCAYKAVTVFRVGRVDGRASTRLGSQARALDADQVTIVTLRPSSRFSSGLR